MTWVPETSVHLSYPGQANFSLISLKHSTDCLHEDLDSGGQVFLSPWER